MEKAAKGRKSAAAAKIFEESALLGLG